MDAQWQMRLGRRPAYQRRSLLNIITKLASQAIYSGSIENVNGKPALRARYRRGGNCGRNGVRTPKPKAAAECGSASVLAKSQPATGMPSIM